MNPRKTISDATNTFAKIMLIYLTVLVLSGGFFAYFEDKPIFESLWWACVTGLTIGYGDMYPVTLGGKIVAIALMHIVPLIIIPLIVTRLLTSVIENRDQFTHEEQEEMKGDLAKIKKALNIKD
jgi:voltage-gated potassium channel